MFLLVLKIFENIIPLFFCSSCLLSLNKLFPNKPPDLFVSLFWLVFNVPNNVLFDCSLLFSFFSSNNLFFCPFPNKLSFPNNNLLLLLLLRNILLFELLLLVENGLLFMSLFSSLFSFLLISEKREVVTFLFSCLKLNILPVGLFPENIPVPNNGLFSNFSLFSFLKIFSNGDIFSLGLFLFFDEPELLKMLFIPSGENDKNGLTLLVNFDSAVLSLVVSFPIKEVEVGIFLSLSLLSKENKDFFSLSLESFSFSFLISFLSLLLLLSFSFILIFCGILLNPNLILLLSKG